MTLGSLDPRPAASPSDGLQGYYRTMAPRLADNELTAFLDEFNARQIPSAAETGAAALRAAAAERAAARAKGPELSAVRDLHVPPDGRAARLYRPTAQAAALVLYLHGGGFVFGDLETHDRASGASPIARAYRCSPWTTAGHLSILGLPRSTTPSQHSGGSRHSHRSCRWHLRRWQSQATVPAARSPPWPACACAMKHPKCCPRAQLLIYANTDLGNSGASMQREGSRLRTGRC